MSGGNLKAQIAEYSIGDVFKDGRDKYVVPLYQREYAWGKTEIERLLNDLFLAFEKGGNYYLGSFVVRRSSDDSTCFELVDGQQRLITLSMLFALYLNDNAAKKILSFQLRENADMFIDGCYNRSVLTDEGESAGVGAFRDAVRVIRNFYPETLDEDKKFSHKRGDSIDEILSMVKGEGSFGQFLMKKVILFRVELPESTDVNSYFEIMNNRGEQLQYHEIMKAELLAKLHQKCKVNPSLGQYDELAGMFDDIWTACSRMDGYLGHHLHFCSKYDERSAEGCWTDVSEWSKYQQKLSSEVDKTGGAIERSVIWDFANFLMHALKCYQRKYIPESNVTVSLDEREMQIKYEALEKDIDPVLFLDLLIRLRLKFDKFVVKSENDANGDVEAWRLGYVEKYKKSYNAKNTFDGDNQVRIIAFESMLQVSFNTQRNKDWLQYVLELDEAVFNDKTGGKLLVALKKWAHDRLVNFKTEKEKSGKSFYRLGLETSRFMLNLVDYLMWENYRFGADGGEFAVPNEFVFKYLNSVEHHHPQHDDQTPDSWDKGDMIDDIGNLFLVYSSENSAMSNREPREKKRRYMVAHGHELPDNPKRHWMYEHTQEDWTFGDMQKLSDYVRKLVNAFLG